MSALTISLAAVLAVLAVPAFFTATMSIRGSIRRDGRLGIHTPAASASDEAFALANRVAAPIYFGAAAVGTGVALLVLILRMSTPALLVVGAIGLVAVFALFVAAGTTGERAARSVPMPARKPSAAGAGCQGCGCGSGGCAGLTRTAGTSQA